MLYLFHNIIKNNKKMKYIELVKKISSPVFSLDDLRLEKLTVYPYQLSEWAKKGYIVKLKNGFYAFADKKKEIKNEYISFFLYQPSYISLEWVLSKYGLIPEMVYSLTAITTKTTRVFKNEFGVFTYRHVKPEMFFGYKKVIYGNQAFLIAEPEKALIDFLYLNANEIKNEADMEELRLNEFELKKLNKNKIKKFSKIIRSAALNNIIKILC